MFSLEKAKRTLAMYCRRQNTLTAATWICDSMCCTILMPLFFFAHTRFPCCGFLWPQRNPESTVRLAEAQALFNVFWTCPSFKREIIAMHSGGVSLATGKYLMMEVVEKKGKMFIDLPMNFQITHWNVSLNIKHPRNSMYGCECDILLQTNATTVFPWQVSWLCRFVYVVHVCSHKHSVLNDFCNHNPAYLVYKRLLFSLQQRNATTLFPWRA